MVAILTILEYIRYVHFDIIYEVVVKTFSWKNPDCNNVSDDVAVKLLISSFMFMYRDGS